MQIKIDHIVQKRKFLSGFTLIELLVVIAIIGLLAAIVLVSLNSARIKGRDAKRKQDLQQIAIALELFYDKYDAYYPKNAGWVSCTLYAQTDALSHTGHDLDETLVGLEGIMPKMPFDPNAKPQDCSCGTYGGLNYRSYMYYRWNGTYQNYCLYANLENPSTEDILSSANADTHTNQAVSTLYGMDYAICH